MSSHVYAQEGNLVGHIAGEITLKGAINSEISLSAVLSIPKTVSDKDPYQGDYEITPSIDGQVLETENKYMLKDLEILKIPKYDVDNTKGTTVIIGGEREYGN